MATALTASSWFSLPSSSPAELNLKRTLHGGQAFRWRFNSGSQIWTGVFGDAIVNFKQTDSDTLVRYWPAERSQEVISKKLTDYFQLRYSLKDLCSAWGGDRNQRDQIVQVDVKVESKGTATGELVTKAHLEMRADFKSAGSKLTGLRLLRQDPAECLFSFICSQNNNIARITKMIDSLCTHYGSFIGEVEGERFFMFPSTKTLAAAEETKLRELGFGYRAKFIPAAAKTVLENGGDEWLQKLREEPDTEKVKAALVELSGVGPKVADCVALFSLDKLDIVPVDTHVWQIAQRYVPALRNKTATPKLHPQVASFFRTAFGEQCGWAHSIMFAAELRSFQSELEETDVKEEDAKPKKKVAVKQKTVVKKRLSEEDEFESSEAADDDEEFREEKRKQKSPMRTATKQKKQKEST